MRKRPRSRDWKTSDERIASASVTKEKRKRKQVSAYPGAQQLQAHGNGEIVTLPPLFSSDVLIEPNRAELLSEEVLHKLFHEFCHGQRTNDRGSRTENTYILREDGSR